MTRSDQSRLKPQLAFFDVDTREPSVDGKRLVFRARVDPIRENLERLLAFQNDGGRLIVSSACLNAAPIKNALADTVRYVGIDEADIDWSRELSRRSEFFLEKRSLGCPEANRNQGAFDPFRWNPNGTRIVRAAGAKVWCVFGVSLEYCLRSTALGLLNSGQKVVVPRDAVIPRPDDEPSASRVLKELESRGVQLTFTSEFLQAHAG